MNPQNPQNPNQPQGQQPQPGYQPPQQPQVYGPQQYSPMPVTAGTPGQEPQKSKKKLIIAAVTVAVLLVITIIVAVFANLLSGDGGEGSGNKITRQYDSPVGLLPGMQSADVKSGKFKLTASYVTGNDFTREGTFSVDDGRIAFDMVADDARVNEFMKILQSRRNNKVLFDQDKHGVDRYQSYDFASMLGYHYLYNPDGGKISGFIPEVDAARRAEKPGKIYTLTTTCDSALADVKAKTDMSTTGLSYEFRAEGVNKTRAKVSFAALQEIDKSVVAFFDNCYNLNLPKLAWLKKFVDGMRNDVTTSPTFTYWQDDGVQHLEVSAPPEDTPFGGGMHFEMTETSTSAAAETAEDTGSYVERRNQFGLAFSLCRVDPVVTTNLNAGYTFMREDPNYKYPSVADTGYYCRTLDVPSQFKPVGSMVLRSTTGAKVAIPNSAVHELRGWHDLVYETELFGLDNERYPGSIEFRDIANSNMGALTSVTQGIFADKSLTYTPAPAGCVGTCNDFVLSLVPAVNVQVQRTTYLPE